MSVLITTYEGTHNHPLPLSATAMASTTSAAASMLQSQSSTSQPGLGGSLTAPLSSSSSTSFQGLNFTLHQNTRSPQQFYFPNSSITNSNSHPTITLDLTAPTTTTAAANPSSLFNRFSYNAPRASSTYLKFSSPSPISSLEANNNTLQTSWSSGYPGYGMLSYNRNVGSLKLGRQPHQEQVVHQPAGYSMPVNNQAPSHQQALTETIAAATKVIASNPDFRSALAAAITSVVGNSSDGAKENHGP